MGGGTPLLTPSGSQKKGLTSLLSHSLLYVVERRKKTRAFRETCLSSNGGEKIKSLSNSPPSRPRGRKGGEGRSSLNRKMGRGGVTPDLLYLLRHEKGRGKSFLYSSSRKEKRKTYIYLFTPRGKLPPRRRRKRKHKPDGSGGSFAHVEEKRGKKKGGSNPRPARKGSRL